MKKQYVYGGVGLLSLLGLIGVFTEDKEFLMFFAFAVHFEYFFMDCDEMLDKYMMKSASRGFYSNMIVMCVVALYQVWMNGVSGNEALATAFSIGWSAAIIMYSLSTAYFGVKETIGLEYD